VRTNRQESEDRLNSVTYDILTQRIKQVGSLPAMPAILSTLCEALSLKTHLIDIDKIVKQISCDKSLTAQSLRLANSALFRQRGDVATVREAVLALGLWRIRDLAFSCSLPVMFANVKTAVAKEVFWRHALGTAVVAQHLSEELGTKAPEEVYLAGLLHDIGILVNGTLFSDDFRDVLQEAIQRGAPLDEIETKVLGFTHSESGRILAELWRLPVEISEVIEHHHEPSAQKPLNDTTLIVHVADLVCHKCTMGYGYDIARIQALSLEEIWAQLEGQFPVARTYGVETFSRILNDGVAEAQTLADNVFTPAMAEVRS
jgi:putative nucleotidyltransferase with HDIG domain